MDKIMDSFLSLSLPRAVYLLLTVALMSTTARASGKDDYKQLFTNLGLDSSGNYSRDIRPINERYEPTAVYMTLALHSILEVNEQHQTLTTNTELLIDWDDWYLVWNPEDYANISSILMRQERLWIPDIVMSNTVSSQTELGYKNLKEKLRWRSDWLYTNPICCPTLKLRIDFEGMVEWYPAGIFETTCEMDITYYPFDTQVCDIIFMTAISLKDEIEVYIDKEDPIDMSDYSPNGLWLLVNYSAANNDQEDSRTKITFKLQLQRRRSYYILNIILPVLLLSMTSSLTFALPSDAGEKMGLSITVLLAYAVYLTLVTDAMPHTSVQVSVVGIYLILLLAVSAASVVLSVLVLRFHHRAPSRPVTGCLLRLVVVLRIITCMDKLKPGGRGGGDEDGNGEGGENEKKITRSNAPPVNMVFPTANADEPQTAGDDCVVTHTVKAASGREVAETLDKFIFLLFTFIVLGSTIVCMIVLIVGANKQENDAATLVANERIGEDYDY